MEGSNLYIIIKVATDEDLVRHIGRHMNLDLVDNDNVRSFRFLKQTPFSLFKEEIAKEFGIPVQFQRFWLWAKRQNNTYRPHRPVTALEEAQSVGQLKNTELHLFLEVEFGLDLLLIPPPEKSEEDILVFFKLYDLEKGELSYIGRLFVKRFGRPIEILEKLNQMAGFVPDEEIELYEEIRFEPSVMCVPINKRFTFQASEIQDGDIICFQKARPVESEEECLYPDVPSFLEYINNRRIVHFRSLEKPREDNFCLELSKLDSYDEVVERMAHRIGLDDPSKIRLTSHNCYSQQPKPQPIKYRGVENLSEMLVHYYQISDILYYEVLEVPLPELRSFKILKVAFHHTTKDEEIKFEPSVICEPVNKRVSFLASQLEDGGIVCFQKIPPVESEEECQYPDLPSFFEFLHNRQIVHFRSLDKPKEDNFFLELSKLHSYDEVVERVARRIGLDDPSKIRLTSQNRYFQQPNPQPIKYRGVENLSDMLVHYNQMSEILYYEVLDIPLPVLQGLKNLKIAFHHATKDEVVIYNIRLPKHNTVGDVIIELKTKVELSHPNAELRLLEILFQRIYKIFPLSEKIEHINDQYWTLRAEETLEEEKNLGSQDRLIHVCHFTKESAQNQMQVKYFGEPFVLVIHEGETLAEIKVRIQKKLQVTDEEFSKWKFVFFSLGRLEYMQDSDVVFTRFQGRDVYSIWEHYLGLEHSVM